MNNPSGAMTWQLKNNRVLKLFRRSIIVYYELEK